MVEFLSSPSPWPAPMNFVISENPGVEWDAFAKRHTSSLFYCSAWGQVLKNGLGSQLCYMYLESSDGIVCGMPGIILKYYGVKLFYSAIPYGGCIGCVDLFDDFMERVVAATKAVDVVYVTPYAQVREEAYSAHFKMFVEIATRIDLRGRGLDAVWSDFKPSVRQSLNKGRRLGVKIWRGSDRESFLVAHRLYLQTMQRNRAIARYGNNWFNALHDILAGDERVFVYLAHYGGSPISATVVVNSELGYHLLHSGSCPEYLWLRANDLIVCEIISDAIRERKEFVDFMFSEQQDTNLIRWKEKFGGNSILWSKYRRINSPLKHVFFSTAKKIYPSLNRSMKIAGFGQR